MKPSFLGYCLIISGLFLNATVIQGEPLDKEVTIQKNVAETPEAKPSSLPIESDWRARAMHWFTSTETKKQRKEMRTATRALRQPCRYCHTPDFKGYTDKRLVTQQMMALSAEHGVTCTDCHNGKNTFTKMGETAQKMWSLSRQEKIFCDGCHIKGKAFKLLNEFGEKYKAKSGG